MPVTGAAAAETPRELHDPIVLNDRRSASNLKQNKVMIDTVEANIPLCPLDTMGVATEIYCYESVQASRAGPTDKCPAVDGLWVVSPPFRSERISPTLVIQFRHVGEVAARLHHR
jgi:hypothetical protein